jgi:Short repeat of unknown function (DUF308)
LAGPKVEWWWTGLLLGIAELVLGVWAVRSWERSLLTLMTLVGVWAIVYGVNEIFAAFTLRETGKRAERAADSGHRRSGHRTGPAARQAMPTENDHDRPERLATPAAAPAGQLSAGPGPKEEA